MNVDAPRPVPVAGIRPEELAAEAAHAAAAGAAAVADTDLAALGDLSDRLDATALLAIAHTLRQSGLFPTSESAHTTAEILTATGVAPRHRRIVRRWLWALAREGRLRTEGDRHHGLRAVTARELQALTAKLERSAAGLRYGPAMSGFLIEAMAYLPELLRDELSLQSLLFADDTADTAEGFYRRNVGSRYLNRATGVLARALARRRPAGAGPLRVLEVGAGVGGTTGDVLDALNGIELDYLFTDVSRYFLTDAARRFHGRDDLRLGLFDINRELTEQGYRPGTADLVLAANVLHNARHAGRTARRMHDLLAPGGWLVFIDTSRDHYSLMTSMEFLMSPAATEPDAEFTDFRRDTDRIFPTRQEWLGVLAGAGFAPIVSLPGPEEAVARFGQFAYAGQKAGVS